jgi:UDP-glucose 4-epimerase
LKALLIFLNFGKFYCRLLHEVDNFLNGKIMNILLTGGAGYIGSHTFCALDRAGFSTIILDNFSNSNHAVIARLHKITGKPVTLAEGDVGNRDFVQDALERYKIDAVIHFAAFKAVGESCEKPLQYYRNNVGGLISLLEAMEAARCHHLVYSSSATVYGNPRQLPIDEQAPLCPTNPYGHTKLIGEEILASLQKNNPNFKVSILRYFNPVGAHESGLIGEDPIGIPNNLMPFIAQVAAGMRPLLNVYGNDYATPDGTGVRDYIHVVDLAEGHVVALDRQIKDQQGVTVNLGTGRGYSVLEMINIFESVSDRKIPYQIVARRLGDIASCYADVTLAQKRLGWATQRAIHAMCTDVWRWQSNNPKGYG